MHFLALLIFYHKPLMIKTMKRKELSAYMARIGRKGGKASRRLLSSEQSRKMLKIREAKRAFRNFHSRCFWSFQPKLVITEQDVMWVAEQLMKSGDRKAFETGAKLCL